MALSTVKITPNAKFLPVMRVLANGDYVDDHRFEVLTDIIFDGTGALKEQENENNLISDFMFTALDFSPADLVSLGEITGPEEDGYPLHDVLWLDHAGQPVNEGYKNQTIYHLKT